MLASALRKCCTSLPGYHIANAAGTCLAALPQVVPLIVKDSLLGYNRCVCTYTHLGTQPNSPVQAKPSLAVLQLLNGPGKCKISWCNRLFGDGSAPCEVQDRHPSIFKGMQAQVSPFTFLWLLISSGI